MHSRSDVARAVGDELCDLDRRRWGSVTDIGMFHRWYVANVDRLLEQLDGTAVLIRRG
jgi:hypothetical protein